MISNEEIQIVEQLTLYGYSIMLPLMILEGPIATIVSAFFASLGMFNVYVVLILSIFGDIFGDLILYWFGYYGGMPFVKKFGKYVGLKASMVKKMQKYFASHGGKTIFVIKSTTGLCWVTFFCGWGIKNEFFSIY